MKPGTFFRAVLVIVFLIALGCSANAQVLSETIATGGIPVSTHDGLDNLFYNPARLGFSGFRLKLAAAGLSFDGNNKDFFKFIKNHSSKLDKDSWGALDTKEQDKIRAELAALDPRTQIGFSPGIGLAVNKFAIGAYATSYTDLELKLANPTGSFEYVHLEARQLTEAVVVMGLSNNILDRIALGVNARYINRWEDPQVAMEWRQAGKMKNWIDLLWQDKKNLVSGYTVGAGVAVKPTDMVLVEYMADDLLFDLGEEKRDPRGRIQATVEFRDYFITGIVSARAIRLGGAIASTEELMPVFDAKKAAAGIEVEYPILKLRGGINDGNYSYGANIDLALFNVGYASQLFDGKSRFHTVEVAMEF